MMDDMEEIWVLYADDGAQALDTAEQALQAIVGGTPEAMADGVASLFRAVHTFKGNARVLGLSNAESRAHVTEDLMGLIRDQGAPWDDEIEQILVLAIDRLRDILEQTASQRRDIDESFAEDLMRLVTDKIERIAGGNPSNAAVGTTSETPDAVPTDDPPSLPTYAEKAVSLLSQIAGPLDHLGQLRLLPDSAKECGQILRNIASLAETCGYVRLADVALSLEGQADTVSPIADARLYEELVAIELSLPQDILPHPAPHAMYQHWCAVNAPRLIAALRDNAWLLSNDPANPTHSKTLAQMIRQVSRACLHHGLDNASAWAMALHEALISADPVMVQGQDRPIFLMVEALAATVAALLPAETAESVAPIPVQHFRASTQAGLLDEEAVEELQALNLPLNVLLNLSAATIQPILHAARAGSGLWIASFELDQLSVVTAAICALGEGSSFRPVAVVPLRSGTSVRVQFILTSQLVGEQVRAELAALSPDAIPIPLEQLGKAVPAAPQAHGALDGSSGVSVEMLETLGDISAGLAELSQRLERILHPEEREGSEEDTGPNLNGHSHSDLSDKLSRMVEGIETSFTSLEVLSQRVSDLQEDAMISRLRPAAGSLAPVIAGLGRSIRAIAPGISLSFVSDDLMLDNQTLDLIGQLCSAYVQQRAERARGATSVISIALRQREDRAILMVTDRLPEPTDDGALSVLRRIANGSGGRVWTQSHDDGRHGLVFSVPTRALAMEAMIMQSGGTHYGLAVDSMVMVHQAGPEQIMRRAAAGTSRFLKLENGEVLTIVTLENRKVDQGGIFVIMQAAGQRRALLVDALVGHQVVRLRPLQGVMERLDRLSGFAVLSGGQIALVLSPLAICHDHDLSQMAFHEPEERHEICIESPK